MLSYSNSLFGVKHFFFAGPASLPAQKSRFRFSNRSGKLVHRSGEVGLCAFYPPLSTSFFIFFAFCSPKTSNPFISLMFFFLPKHRSTRRASPHLDRRYLKPDGPGNVRRPDHRQYSMRAALRTRSSFCQAVFNVDA